MRICSPHCGAAAGSASGGEAYEHNLLAALGAVGDRVHCLMARDKTAPERTQIHRLPIGRGLRWPVAALLFPRAIRRCWRTCGFDLLRAHSVRFTGPACLLARRRWQLPVPVVAHLHHLDPSPLNRHLELRVLLGADLVIVDSDFVRDQLLDLTPEAKVRVVRPGVADRYRPDPEAARRWAWPGNARVVVAAVGHLIERKDPMLALRVLDLLRRAGYGERIGLVWIGEGPLRGSMQAQAERAGVGGMLRLLGRVDERTKLAVLNRADVFLHTSSLEGFALAPQEAMACGKPVVMRLAASAREMVPEGAGFLGLGSADLAHALMRLTDEPTLRCRMGTAAQSHAERHFGWQRTVDGVRAAYEEAIVAYPIKHRPD